MSMISGVFGSVGKTLASGGIGLYIKIALFAALAGAAGFLYWNYESMKSTVAQQQTTIGQLQQSVATDKATIGGLQTNINDMIKKSQQADAERNAVTSQVNDLQERLASMNLSFRAQLKALKSPQDKQTFINNQWATTMFCVQQLTTDPKSRDPNYASRCQQNGSTSK